MTESCLNDLFSLRGRRALVTGARRGIGQGAAVALAAAGADVVLLARDDQLAETVALVEGHGREAEIVVADVSDLGSTERVITDLVGRCTIDIVINNAGTIAREDAAEVDYPDWARVIDTNLNSAWVISRAAGRAMIDRGSGKIINIASLLSFQGGIRVPAYTAAKHGLAGLTKALANEWMPHGVQVNAIAPGYIATDNTAALRADPVRSAELMSRIPAGRWGTADDLAGAIIFLASTASAYVSGQILPVDGGWMAR